MKFWQRKFMLGGIILGCGILLFFIFLYDLQRSSDIILMNSVRRAHTQLERHYQMYASYPSKFSPNENSNGFTYHPLEKDGSVCQSKVSCPWYDMEFTLKTNALLKKGVHKQTPSELK